MSDPVDTSSLNKHRHDSDALGESNRKYYDQQAQSLFEQDWVRKLSAQLHDCLVSSAGSMGLSKTRTTPTRLLDYACGNGLVSRAWLDYFDQIRGIDVSESMVTAYNHLAHSAGIDENRMRAMQGNLVSSSDSAALQEDVGLGDFDAVVISMALHHMAEPDVLLAKLVNRLRTGGLLVVLDWTTDEADGAGDRHSDAVGGHTIARTSFSAEEMSAMMMRAGCRQGSAAFYPYKESSHIPEAVTKTPGGVDRTFFLAMARK